MSKELEQSYFSFYLQNHPLKFYLEPCYAKLTGRYNKFNHTILKKILLIISYVIYNFVLPVSVKNLAVQFMINIDMTVLSLTNCMN